MKKPLHSVHDVYDGLFNTATGNIIDINNPQPAMFHLEDIAAGLSKICRFGGQINELYTVAQHSLLVCRFAPDDLKLEALMHDAAEAYLGDVIKPLKVILGSAYTDIEERFMQAIATRFHLDLEKLQAIKLYDKQALTIEHEYFQCNNPTPWWTQAPEELPYYRHPGHFEKIFIQTFHHFQTQSNEKSTRH